ncbi:MAG: hypothetical protein OEZ39_08910 [Gammaproteobacteria bacterium]|nr:hypothetical protein [Gammaproteobacteria bacterium]MDH5651984.1 hypothetical protein [Gammaproteobacteria bacterium]
MASASKGGSKGKQTGKAVNISARISEEDAQFLNQLKLPDAVTPSDKLRAIIADARERRQRRKDYRSSFDMLQGMLSPFGTKMRELEMQHNVHSEVVSRALEWLPDMMAFLIVSESHLHKESDREQMEHIEDGIADRLFRLMGSVMQLGISERCPCYATDVVYKRLDPVLDLARVISK